MTSLLSRHRAIQWYALLMLISGDSISQPQAVDQCAAERQIFQISQGGRKYWIKQDGTALPEALRIEVIGRFRNGMATFSSGKKVGILDAEGRILVPAEYDKLDLIADRPVAVFAQGDRYGILEPRTGKILVPAQYASLDRDGMRTGDLTAFSVDGRTHGYLDSKIWKVVIPPRFDGAEAFNQYGFAVAMQGGKKGLIGRDGTWIVKPEYTEVRFLDNRRAVRVRTDAGYGIANLRGVLAVAPDFKDIDEASGIRFSGGKFAIYRMPWAEIEQARAPISLTKHVLVDALDLEPQRGQIVRGGKHGLISPDATGVLAPNYARPIGVRSGNGIRAFQIDGKWAIADDAYQLVTAAQYEEAEPFATGLMRVKIAERWGIINGDGKFVQWARFDAISRVEDGLASYWEKGSIGVLSADGTLLSSNEFDAVLPASEGMMAVLKNGKWGYIGANRRRIATTFAWAEPFSEGMAAVNSGGRWGYVGLDGGMKVPPSFVEVTKFEDGLARVRDQSGLLGIINKQGQFVLAAGYREIRHFGADRAAFQRVDWNWGFIDRSFRSVGAVFDGEPRQLSARRRSGDGYLEGPMAGSIRRYTCSGLPVSIPE